MVGVAIGVIAVAITSMMFVGKFQVMESMDLAAHFATLTAVIIGVVWLSTKFEELHVLVNSRMTDILELQATKSFGEGIIAERKRVDALKE